MSTRQVVRRIVVAVSLVGGIFLAVENLWAILRPAPSLELSPCQARSSPDWWRWLFSPTPPAPPSD
jgi:hypothetical protein